VAPIAKTRLPASRLHNAINKYQSITGTRAKKKNSKIMTQRNEPKKVICFAASQNEVAYERKKQRAKDGRIKLNTAIEKLSVAMNLAGSQSQKRSSLVQSHESQCDTKQGEIMDRIVDPQTLRSIMECAEISSTAKKWDRPSFVDTAAALIHALNSQCESLLKEIMKKKGNIEVDASSKIKRKVDQDSHEIAEGCKEESGSHKRQKCAEDRESLDDLVDVLPQTHKDAFKVITSYGPILTTIVSFLDPLSILRSLSVAKYWNSILEFKTDSTWIDLCRRRFGVFKVHSWEKQHNLTCKSKGVVSGMDIYRLMSKENISPFTLLEGNSKLGDNKINGVSVWASILECSNGETLRSVKKSTRSSNSKQLSSQITTADMVGGEYSAQPVIELRIVIQNTQQNMAVVVPEQTISVDASTRRRGETFKEVLSDDRFTKDVLKINSDGSEDAIESMGEHRKDGEMVRLKLFDSAVLIAYIFARGCPTYSKFKKKANFVTVLVNINETTTVPVVIPFKCNQETVGNIKT